MAPRPANILLITSDQQHWNTLGCRNPELRTPALDALAAQGTRYSRAYCPNPTCTPTRASIITGQYPSQHGAYSLGTKLPEDALCIGDVLRDAGYRSSLIGKAHFQQLKPSDDYPSLEAMPLLQDLEFWRHFNQRFYGFDKVELARMHADEYLVGQHYAIWMQEQGCTNWRDYFRPPTGTRESNSMIWDIPERYHYNEWIAQRSIADLERHAADEQPFFLWSSFFDPHPPYLVPEPWASMYDPADLTVPALVPGEHERNPPHFRMTQEAQPDFSYLDEAEGSFCHGCKSHLHDRDALARQIAIYYGMVSYMDQAIGRIVDKLDALGLAENTLVVFTSDHGHLFGQHGMIAKGPFHYDDLLRVPFIVRQPGTVPAGVESDALQSLVDLAPSFCAHCGVDVPRVMSGVDQGPVWRGERERRREHVIVENHHQPHTMHLKSYIDQRWKLTCYHNEDFGELFDLRDDPDELHNRWDDPDYAERKAALLLRAVQYDMRQETTWMPRVSGA